MRDRVRWLAGDPHHRSALEGAVRALAAGAPEVEVLAEKPGRRRLARAELASGERVFLKHYPPYPPPTRGWLRAWCKRRLGFGPDSREWRMLVRLRRAGIRVPEPLAHVALPDGGRVVATRFVPGRPLAEALRCPARERRALLDAVGRLVGSAHAAGVVHRDLHIGNLFVGEDGPLLLDLQAALPSRSTRARVRDLGELDASLASRASRSDRVRVATAALDVTRPFDAPAREAIRSVARASRARARAHWRSRTQRALRPGRQYARVALREGRGMRLREVPEARVLALLSGEVRDAGIAVQRFRAHGLGAVLAQWLRGSPARLAWCAGQGLRARGIASERPLAYVESRRFGVPIRSVLVLECLPALDAGMVRADPARFLDALADLIAAMHERDVRHTALDRSALRRAPDGALALGQLTAVRFQAPRESAQLASVERLTLTLAPWLDAAMQARLQILLRYTADAQRRRCATTRALPSQAPDQRGAIVTQR